MQQMHCARKQPLRATQNATVNFGHIATSKKAAVSMPQFDLIACVLFPTHSRAIICISGMTCTP
jgi:hypothetical protein